MDYSKFFWRGRLRRERQQVGQFLSRFRSQT
jgi:hypothetical protein